VTDLATGLAERNHEVLLCGPALPVGLAHAGAYPHARLDLQRTIAPRRDLAAIAHFTRLVRRLRPNLIHAHSSKAGAIARLARLRHPGVPVIYTAHGYAFAGHFARALERSGYREIERVLAPLASRVACVCQAEARLARAIGPAGRVRVVYNGIGAAIPGPVDARVAELAKSGPVVCALTGLRPGKGIETLIDALVEVLTRHPRAQVAIGGDGPDLEVLSSRARVRGVAHAVHFLGAVADPLSTLRGARLFVHPSLAESFPYVILEAMTVGLPIVASDVGGVGEALTHGESGLLVPPGNPRALARALIDLLEDPDRGTRMGAAASVRVQQRFSRTRMIDDIIEVYDELTRHEPDGR
jgi:glycosyltransferase involved in cell wall biosynthesis